MSACPACNFVGVTPEVFQCVCETVRNDFGIVVNGDSGEFSQDGFTVTWNYQPSSSVATIQCTDSPWWVPCSAINGKIQSIGVGCGAQVAQ